MHGLLSSCTHCLTCTVYAGRQLGEAAQQLAADLLTVHERLHEAVNKQISVKELRMVFQALVKTGLTTGHWCVPPAKSWTAAETMPAG